MLQDKLKKNVARITGLLCHSPQADWYVSSVEVQSADWSILVMSSENPSLISERWLNGARGTLSGSSEGMQDPSAGVWSLGS